MLDWRYTVGEGVSDDRAQEGEAHGFEARERGAVRDGRGLELAPPSARCALREGGHARNWALFIIAGSERGKSGKATQMPNSLTWPYVRIPFVVTRRRGRRSLPKRLMLMKTARFLAGWDARVAGRSWLRGASPMLSAVCWTRRLAAKIRGETVKPSSCPCRQTEAT